MLRLETILAPVDFSERTETEARNAAVIAKHFGSKLILAHVIPRFADLYPVDPEAREAYSQQFSVDVDKGAKKALLSLANRVATGVDVECIALSGDPAEKIEELATSRKADLIVMPTAGRGRVRRHLLGSVTTRVLHDLKCPVYTGVHLPEGGLKHKVIYENVACKLVMGEDGAAQVRWASDFAASYDSLLHVVCVLPFLDSTGAAPSMPEPLRQKALADAEAQMHSLIGLLGVDAEVTALGGPIEQVLPAYLRDRNIDLLVSGRRRSQDTMGVFGQHTDLIDTVKCIPCPMVAV